MCMCAILLSLFSSFELHGKSKIEKGEPVSPDPVRLILPTDLRLVVLPQTMAPYVRNISNPLTDP